MSIDYIDDLVAQNEYQNLEDFTLDLSSVITGNATSIFTTDANAIITIPSNMKSVTIIGPANQNAESLIKKLSFVIAAREESEEPFTMHLKSIKFTAYDGKPCIKSESNVEIVLDIQGAIECHGAVDNHAIDIECLTIKGTSNSILTVIGGNGRKGANGVEYNIDNNDKTPSNGSHGSNGRLAFNSNDIYIINSDGLIINAIGGNGGDGGNGKSYNTELCVHR